ncbi:MAG: tRNA pseudouridine(38-40) synthase TruA [Acidimicrobiaceae bacterium]|nr:tRNA pseudouridine(38-40) synthase TruA [Acidimicrobiaceae bacterium]
MTLAYDGSQFHGFAQNEGVATVAGVLSEALSRVLGAEVDIVCAGRTDRGVHARAQVVSFDAPARRVDPPRLMRAVNRMCAPHIAVSQVSVVADDFNARHCCSGRVYRYRILNSATPDPLAAAQSWHVEHGLDLRAMRAAADLLVGDHDFSSFCRRNPSKPDQSMIRTVRRAVWWTEGDFAVFEIEARSFCHQMVRSLVALLVSVGSGRHEPKAVVELIAARDRGAVPSPAPPQGLVLWSALYDADTP